MVQEPVRGAPRHGHDFLTLSCGLFRAIDLRQPSAELRRNLLGRPRENETREGTAATYISCCCANP